MNQIELHILQTSNVGCVNRDDLNQPKTSRVGDTLRGRISSQCFKRAIRDTLRELSPEQFASVRTRYIEALIAQELIKLGKDEEKASSLAHMAVTKFLIPPGKAKRAQDAEKAKRKKASIETVENDDTEETDDKTKMTIYFAESEISNAAKALASAENPDKLKQSEVFLPDFNSSVDILLFGRMLANAKDMDVEAAASFTHAITTHKVTLETDFFSSMDEAANGEKGSSMMGNTDYNSGTYYRYITLNLDHLFGGNLLPNLPVEIKKKIIATFIRACIIAHPRARQHGMASRALPPFVMGMVRRGQPMDLSGAFEIAVPSEGSGFTVPSVMRLREYKRKVFKTYGISAKEEYVLDVNAEEGNLEELVTKLTEAAL